MKVKQLFEETITISIEKYDDLMKKAGVLENFQKCYPGMFGAYTEEKEEQEEITFEEETIYE